MTKVLVSGASGFIALHIIQQLTDKGYEVVGTVRSTKKGDDVKLWLKNDKFSYDIVEDISKPDAFDDFVKKHSDATVFLHTASPFHFKTNDAEKDLLIPAIEGTKGVLNSIHKYGPQIKRVVVTSSYAAIADFGANEPAEAKDKTFDEATWNPVTWEQALKNPLAGYCASKTFAEKAAWEFVEKNKPNFVLSTVNPTYVFGPQAFEETVGDELNTSAEIINQLLKLNKDLKDWPKSEGPCVDVRDVAKAHIVAFEKDEAKNQRLLVTVERFTDQLILDALHKGLPEETKNLPVGEPGSLAKRLAEKGKIDSLKTNKILGFELISMEEMVVASAKQLFEVRARRNKA